MSKLVRANFLEEQVEEAAAKMYENIFSFIETIVTPIFRQHHYEEVNSIRKKVGDVPLSEISVIRIPYRRHISEKPDFVYLSFVLKLGKASPILDSPYAYIDGDIPGESNKFHLQVELDNPIKFIEKAISDYDERLDSKKTKSNEN